MNQLVSSAQEGWTIELTFDREIRFGPVLYSVSAVGFTLPPQLQRSVSDARWTPDGATLLVVTVTANQESLAASLWAYEVGPGTQRQLTSATQMIEIAAFRGVSVEIVRGSQREQFII